MMKFKEIKQVFIAIGCVILLISCGKSKKEEVLPKTEIKTIKKAKVSDTEKFIIIDSDGTVNISINTDDRMKFNLKKITVKAGQKIKLTLTHAGKLEKRIMGHNVVFLKKGVKLSAFALKAAAAVDNDYIPEGTTDVIAHTKLIGGGETTVLEFTAPEVGTYDYICSFPAHFAMMKGKLIVE